MSDEYVESITLEVNGQVIEDFDEVTEKEYETRSAVNLMNKTGFSRKTARHGVTVKYVIPATRAPFDFDSVENGTLTIGLSGGRRITYTDVFHMKTGDVAYGDKAASQTIEFGAGGRTGT